MAIRVLLVDDVVHVRRLVRSALRLRGGFEVAGEADNGADAVRLSAELQPDLVVLDLGLPDLAGHEVLTGIRDASPATKVVVFSGVDGSGLEKQVDGYVPKDAELGFLVDLVETVSRGADMLQAEAHVTARAALGLPRDLTSVRLARHFVRDQIRQWGLDGILDDALLVTSELSANAITHAESDCEIRLTLSAASLRIDVGDGGVGTPEPQPPSATEEHGRGLVLVDAVASAWGLDVMPGAGKVVWAELGLSG
jgi:DNA-binding response OmpR family regulator